MPCMAYIMACCCPVYNYSSAVAYHSSVDDVTDFVENGNTAHGMAVTHTVELGDVTIPQGVKAAQSSAHWPYWRDAIAKELKGLIENATWKIMLLADIPKHANVMRCHFVFALKRLADGTIDKFKARLVANGNSQIEGVDFDQIFSTVVKAVTIRIVLAIACQLDYELTSVDIRQAYLQAELSEDMYMMVPPGLPRVDSQGRPLVLKLQKSLYGLKQAGREWNKLLVTFLLAYGFTQSKIDVCLFQYHANGMTILCLVYVDDLILASNTKKARDDFVKAISKRFPTDDKGDCVWIIGLKITRDRDRRSLSISQEMYVQDLLLRHASSIEHTRKYSSPMDDKVSLGPESCPEIGSQAYVDFAPKRYEYMSIVGGILWLANMTMFHLSYAASQLSRFVHNPGPVHYSAAIRVLCYLRDSDSRVLHFNPNPKRPLVIYVDSNWATKFSSSGAMFFFMGCLVTWFSKVQRSASFSSTEAELFGAIMAAREGIWIRMLLSELGYMQTSSTVIYSDNMSCVKLSYDPVSFKKVKHIILAADGLRDFVARLIFSLEYIPGQLNVADILTKAQAHSVFTSLLQAYDHMVTVKSPA
jgi:hypothetical protein